MASPGPPPPLPPSGQARGTTSDARAGATHPRYCHPAPATATYRPRAAPGGRAPGEAKKRTASRSPRHCGVTAAPTSSVHWAGPAGTKAVEGMGYPTGESTKRRPNAGGAGAAPSGGAAPGARAMSGRAATGRGRIRDGLGRERGWREGAGVGWRGGHAPAFWTVAGATRAPRHLPPQPPSPPPMPSPSRGAPPSAPRSRPPAGRRGQGSTPWRMRPCAGARARWGRRRADSVR